jgi:hypothetical protein
MLRPKWRIFMSRSEYFTRPASRFTKLLPEQPEQIAGYCTAQAVQNIQRTQPAAVTQGRGSLDTPSQDSAPGT